MPNDDPQGSTEIADSSPTSDWMPSEVAATLAEMSSGLGIQPNAPEETSDDETPGDQADQDGNLGRPADEESARGFEGATDDDGDTPTTDDVAATELAGDLSDDELAALPDKVKAALAALPRNVKGALFGHVKQQVRGEVQAEVETAQQTATRLREDADAAEAQKQTVRSKVGKHIGAEPVEVKDQNGNVIRTLPTYDQVVHLLSTKGGEDILSEKHGLSVSDAQDLKAMWDENAALVTDASGYFDDQAWRKLSFQQRQALLAVEGINADEIVKDAKGPQDVIAKLVATLRTQHQTELARVTKDLNGRIESLTLNSTALKGRAVAGERAPITGGRSGSGAGQMSEQRLKEMLSNPNEYRKNKDAIYAAIGIK